MAGLVQAGLSDAEAERYQAYLDTGVVVVTVGVAGGQAVYRFTVNAAKVAAADRAALSALQAQAVDAGGASLEGVWGLSPTVRGTVIEGYLATTEYKDWFNVGQLNNGKFPLVDFQKGDTLVSVKSVDTTGSSWIYKMKEHIDDLARSDAMVDGKLAEMRLDLRVQPGGVGATAEIVKYAK